MKTKAFMAMAVLALVAAGCNNEETDNWAGEIRLTSGVAVQTRTNTQAIQIQNGEEVYVWVDKASVPAQSYINAWKLTAQGDGSFTTGTSQYYPTDDSDLDFYALHGNFASDITEGSTKFPETGVVHSVEEYQADANMKNYAKSDLLYAVKKGVERSSDAVNLEFYNMLSKVEVALKSGKGQPELEGATVTIEGTKLKANFKPDKDDNMGSGEHRLNMITIVDNDNDPTSIIIQTAITKEFTDVTDYAEAVLLPNQDLKRGDTFIQVRLLSGATFSYKLPYDLTLESGKKYIYKITVNRSGLSVSSNIQDWDTERTTPGDATME